MKILALITIFFIYLSSQSITGAASTWEALAKRADAVMSSIPEVNTKFPNNLISAEALHDKLKNPQEASSIFLLDTRPKNEWDLGHIKGAVSFRLQGLAESKNLAKLPQNKLIVCISSTGHTAVQAATVLRWLGYNAILLEHGMAAWMPTHATKMMQWDIHNGMGKRYPVKKVSLYENGAEKKPVNKQSRLPPLDSAIKEILANAAQQLMRNNIFKKQYPFNHIFADDLFSRLKDSQQRDSLFLLDICSTASRAVNGAIKGSVPINWEEVGKPQNLKKLPKDKLIVVICHTGQTSGQVTPILRMLGYNAVTLRSGMTAWTETTDSQKTLNALCRSNKPCYPIIKK